MIRQRLIRQWRFPVIGAFWQSLLVGPRTRRGSCEKGNHRHFRLRSVQDHPSLLPDPGLFDTPCPGLKRPCSWHYPRRGRMVWLAVSCFLQVSLNLYIFPTNAVSFIPMNLHFSQGTVWQSDSNNPFSAHTENRVPRSFMFVPERCAPWSDACRLAQRRDALITGGPCFERSELVRPHQAGVRPLQ